MKKFNFELRNNVTGELMPEFKTTVEVTLTDKEISFEFFCKNSTFYSACNEYNGLLWEGDVVEAFISTSGDRMKYFEIELAPNNCLFVERIVNHGNCVYTEYPVPIEENFVTSEVELFENDYRAKFSMPLDKIGYDEKNGILLNIFRIETEGGIIDKNLLALSPTGSIFHYPEYFVELKK